MNIKLLSLSLGCSTCTGVVSCESGAPGYQARTNQSMANAQASQAHLDADAHQYTLYAG